MPTVTVSKVEAFAHCADSRCRGNRQEPVKAVAENISISFLDNGGDMPGEERSMRHLRFAREADASCSVCGGPREVSDQKRPVYANVSGHDQAGLLKFKTADGEFVIPVADDGKTAELEDKIEKLTALVEKLTAGGASS